MHAMTMEGMTGPRMIWRPRINGPYENDPIGALLTWSLVLLGIVSMSVF